MTVFDRFMNPVWYATRGLTNEQKLHFCRILISYGSVRYSLESHLLYPMDKILTGVTRHGAATNRELFIDEAVVFLCRCCNRPDQAVDDALPSSVVRSLPDIWGAFALADLNDRMKSTYGPTNASPVVLEQCGGPLTIDEACRGLVSAWAGHIENSGIGQTQGLIGGDKLLTVINESDFATEWNSCANYIVSGLLKGMSRVSTSATLAAGKRDALNVPSHRRADVEYVINIIAKHG